MAIYPAPARRTEGEMLLLRQVHDLETKIARKDKELKDEKDKGKESKNALDELTRRVATATVALTNIRTNAAIYAGTPEFDHIHGLADDALVDITA